MLHLSSSLFYLPKYKMNVTKLPDSCYGKKDSLYVSCNRKAHQKYAWVFLSFGKIVLNVPELWIWLWDVMHGRAPRPSLCGVQVSFCHCRSGVNVEASKFTFGVWKQLRTNEGNRGKPASRLGSSTAGTLMHHTHGCCWSVGYTWAPRN